MYKMIIVDDEQYTRDGMKIILPWESYNIRIVAVCTSAEEGIEAARKYEPDIIITDIKMKNSDGLFMVEEIKKFMKCQFIVISGHSVFEYAQRAIKAEVTSYLLKPVPRVELEAAVMKCIMKIDASRMNNVAQSLGNSEYVVDILINGEIAADDLLPFGSYTMAIIKYSGPVVKSYDDKIRIFENLNNAYGQVFMLFLKADEMIFIMDSGRNDGKWDADFGEECHIGVSIQSGGEKFKDVYKNAQTALGQAIREDKRLCVFGDNTVVYMSDFYNDAYSSVMMYLEDGEVQAAKREIKKCFSKARTDRVLYSDIMRWSEKLFYSISDFARKSIEEPEFVDEIEARFKAMTSAKDTFDFAASECIFDVCELCGNEKDLQSVADKNEKIREIVAYIDEHYNEDISLESLSRMFWLEKKYLSKLFKKYVGENYVEYVTKKRVDAAKQMLEDGTLTISEIAERVSYCDSNYFAVLFKKSVGMTPKEYRLKYMK